MDDSTTDRRHMARALLLARRAERLGEVPIGAVLVDSASDKVIAIGTNRVERDRDPTAHAELLVIRRAARKLGLKRLVGLDLYVTLEPCPMCAQAIAFARLRRVYFGAEDAKAGGVIHGPKIFDQRGCNHRPTVIGGMGAAESGKLLRDFFAARRQEQKQRRDALKAGAHR